MTMEEEALNEHDKFKQLAAMATAGPLTANELADLKNHLRTCEGCREAYQQYRVLTREGFPILAASYDQAETKGDWDVRRAHARLFASIRIAEMEENFGKVLPRIVFGRTSPALSSFWTLMGTAATACVVVGMVFGAYYLGGRGKTRAKPTAVSVAAAADERADKLASEKRALEVLLRGQSQKLAQLQAESSRKQQDMDELRAALQSAKALSDELSGAKLNSEEQLRAASQQRDSLAAQLRDAESAYGGVQVELTNLRAERDKATLRLSSLESQVSDLTAANRDQEERLKATEGFLSSDRDIRELMGARNLYIADVFDVDSSSRTRKPFGRVFYTQGKSLIFYAFDLDRQPGIKNAVFQAWGQRELPQGEKAQPVSLGILYMDNQTNRRWALHCEDPKQLAQIDAVFVTVEPLGGSTRPTGKQLLYAMLRKEANHP